MTGAALRGFRVWGAAPRAVFEAGEALLGLSRACAHKVLPSKTEDRVVGVPGTSESAGVTSYSDFACTSASNERGGVLLPFVQQHRHNFHLGDQQAGELAAAFQPNPAIALGSLTALHALFQQTCP